MRPALEPGDRLLVVRWPRLKPGHVVALRDPSHKDRTLVKRVRHLDGDFVEVRGDNDAASTDSRQFGAVNRRFVRGRVIYRYFPAGRVGRIP